MLSRRSPDGSWASEDITPPHTRATPTSIGGGLEYKLFSPELDEGPAGAARRDAALARWQANAPPTCARTPNRPPTEPLLSAANALPGFGGDAGNSKGLASVAAASADLRHAVVTSQAPLVEGGARPTPCMPGAPTRPRRSRSAGERAAGRGSGGGEGRRGRARRGPKRNAISEDGARAFFSAGNGSLYVRDLAREETARLDVVQSGAFGTGSAAPLFQGAAADGGAALFTDSRELSADASEEGRDLYRCELVSGRGRGAGLRARQT